MIQDKTVLILGAGASWHYGFPTGETLIKEVCKRADKLIKLYEQDQHQRSTLNFQRSELLFQSFLDLFYYYKEEE